MTTVLQRGFLVLQRYGLDQTDPVSLGVRGQTPRILGSVHDVLVSYRGFEGILWPHVPATITLVEGLASVEQLPAVRRYAAELSSSIDCQLLYCCRAADSQSCDPLPFGFVALGFDVGVYRGEDNCYSAIFHELLFGRHDELADSVERLNKNLLFSGLQSAREFLHRRADLLADGVDLETDEDEFEALLVAEAFIGEVPARDGVSSTR